MNSPLVYLSASDPAFHYYLKRANADELRDAISVATGKATGQKVRLRALKSRLNAVERKAAKL